MGYEVIFTELAQKAFDKLPLTTRNLINKKLNLLAENPWASNNNIKKLKEKPNSYRLRQGDYRVIYKIFDTIITLQVVAVDHRRKVYK